MPPRDTGETLALICAPHGRDGAVAASLLNEVGIGSTICENIHVFSLALDNDTCFAVLTEDVLRGDLRGISQWVENQQSWSDLPFVVLTQHGGGPERTPSATLLSEVLGNVTFLERPFHPTTFASVARSALKGRRRQYEARARMLELHEGEERLRTALLAGRLGSWEFDIRSRNLTATSTCKALFGYAADEPFGYDDLLARVHPDDRDRMQRCLRNAIETNSDYEIEYRVCWPDGTIRWADIRARVVRDRSFNPEKLVGVSSDITIRKAAEDTLQKANDVLEARVVERAAELENAHKVVLEEIAQRQRAEELLRQAQKMEMIGQLTGGVAHDFNNLLMAVIGNLDMLSRHVSQDPKTKRLIEGAISGAQRGAALTQRLLAFARRQDLTIRKIDPIELVRGMDDLIQRSISSQIELDVVLPDRLPPVLVDPNQIELALLNLIVNARDAMPEGGRLTVKAAEIVIERSSDLKSGCYVQLSVTDTGQGMSEDVLKKATDPFFSTKELGKGTGLGLSMVQGLALQLGGKLRLKSEVGKGTTADILLPASSGDVLATPKPEDAVPIVADAVKILFVDDDPLIAMSTVDMLEELGHEVVGVESGAKALEILAKGDAVDLLITDYSMPRMSGAQLAEAARELRPKLPILLATGYAELPVNSKVDLPRLGKPYRQDQLAAEIAKALAAKQSA